MLQLSKATDYALLFLTNLARQPEKRWSVREASENLNLPKRFLANIVHKMATSGIVETARGSGGGVTLAREMDRITMWDVVEIFEGPLTIVDCSRPDCQCNHTRDCDARGYWSLLTNSVMESLTTTTLKDLGGDI